MKLRQFSIEFGCVVIDGGDSHRTKLLDKGFGCQPGKASSLAEA